MYSTRNIDEVVAALIDLTGCINSPRQDYVLLREAGISLDRALFLLLVRLGAAKSLSVMKLADQAGRDASTVSRQLAKLEQFGLVKRCRAQGDRRVRDAAVTKAGLRTVAALTVARRKLLGELLRHWSPLERKMFPLLLQRLADAMRSRQAEVD